MTTTAHIQILANAQQHRFDTLYSYAVPANLTITVGHVVFVPFAQRIVTGVVMSLTTSRDATSYKEILARSTICLYPNQLQLAQWMARYYATHLADTLNAFIPHHAIAQPQRFWQLTPAGKNAPIHDIPHDERDVLYAFRQQERIYEHDLTTVFVGKPAAIRTLISHLMQRGYVSTHYEIAAAAVPPRTVRMVTLLQPDTIITRAPSQAAIVAQLLSAPAYTLPAALFSQKTALHTLATRGIVQFHEAPFRIENAPELPPPMRLTNTQQSIVDTIVPTIGTHTAFLLDGVTGSGKTEVYCAIIRAVIAHGQQTLVLVPEIALTTQIADRFEERFPGRVVVLHGQLSPVQRTQRWRAINDHHYDVIIGPRSAVFAPFAQLGLIVIDEEHDSSYKSDAGIRFHARDSAMMYGKISQCPVVLGSATPSVDIMYACQHNRVQRFVLPERVDDNQQTLPRPPIRIIDLKSEATIDPYGLVGTTLASKITTYLADQQQVLLLLNRRGSVSARICRQCGATARCHTCSTPLVIHTRQNQLIGVCHTCGKNSYVNSFCHECFHTEFLDVGSGTQRLQDVVTAHWPDAPVIRWDSDTADSASDHKHLLQTVRATPRAIIVGTQMIAKGFDLPRIRLVGVVNTDTALHLPDMRAAERTYQLLTQVAGRAGRRVGDAEVVFQTYQPEHYAIQAAARYDSELFYQQEFLYRQRMHYPPYTRFIKLIWQHSDNAQCERLAITESQRLMPVLAEFGESTRFIGPAPCFFRRIRNHYRWQAIIVTLHPRGVLTHLKGHTRATIDVDPQSLL